MGYATISLLIYVYSWISIIGLNVERNVLRQFANSWEKIVTVVFVDYLIDVYQPKLSLKWSGKKRSLPIESTQGINSNLIMHCKKCSKIPTGNAWEQKYQEKPLKIRV